MKNAERATGPSTAGVLRSLKEDIFSSLNCVKIGEIVSFDKTKKTAVAKIQFKRVLEDDTIMAHPVLVDVPVFTLQGGGGGIQFPIAAGDQCLLLFADRNIDAWFKTGSDGAPLNGRYHDLSDGIALVGVNALNSSFQNYEASLAKMFFGGATLELKGGKIVFKNAATDFVTALNAFFVALEALQVNTSTGLLQASTVTALEVTKTTLLSLFGAP